MKNVDSPDSNRERMKANEILEKGGGFKSVLFHPFLTQGNDGDINIFRISRINNALII